MGLPFLGVLVLQVLHAGVEEHGQLVVLGDSGVAAQQLVAVLLQALAAHHRLAGLASLLHVALHLNVCWRDKNKQDL